MNDVYIIPFLGESEREIILLMFGDMIIFLLELFKTFFYISIVYSQTQLLHKYAEYCGKILN